MAQLDANIILAGRGPQIANPLDMAEKGMSLRRLAQQNAAADKEASRKQRFSDLMKENTTTDAAGNTKVNKRAALSGLYKEDPTAAMEFEEQVRKQDLEKLTYDTTLSKKAAFESTPETYPLIRQQLIEQGVLNADKLPPPEQFTPQFAQRWQTSVLSGEQQLQQMWKERDFGLKKDEVAAKKAEAGNARIAKAGELATNLRKERSGLPVTKATSEVASAYNKIQTAAKAPSAAGDMSLIFGYMKMLDPGSTVREGEFANAQNAGGIDDKTMGLYNQIRNGQRLTEAQRADFLNQAKGLYSSQMSVQKKVDSQFESLAKKSGLDPKDVLTDFSAEGEIDLNQLPDEQLVELYRAKGGP